ncbi:MAG: hypothetical protein JWM41_4287 [Gemmatimonadetes bacterium]|nr:hypothetical protein [Gemmatimonadota bacterium]
MDTIECRRRDQQGSDTRVVATIGPVDATLEITVDGTRSTRTVPRARIDAVVSPLRDVTLSPVAEHRPVGDPVGYEISFTSGMTQSAFRWIASTPAGWEPIATAADAFLAIARELTRPD